MQSSVDVSSTQATPKLSNCKTCIQTTPLSAVVSTTTGLSPHTSVAAPSTLNVRPEKSSNGTVFNQNNRIVANAIRPVVASLHGSRNTASIATITGPKVKIQGPLIRTAAVSNIQTSSSSSSNTVQGYVAATPVNRSVTTYVVTSTSPTIIQRAPTVNVLPSGYGKPLTMTVNRHVVPTAKPLETVKPYVMGSGKQLITQTNNQIVDRNAAALPTNVSMLTIRGPTIQPQVTQVKATTNSASIHAQRVNTMIVPAAVTTTRKPTSLAPKIGSSASRGPLTIQSIPVSVGAPLSTLSINKKTGINTVSNPLTNSSQAAIVRTVSNVAPQNLITVGGSGSAPMPSANLLIQTTLAQNAVVPGVANPPVFSVSPRTIVYESEPFQVKRTLVSSTSTAFTSTTNSSSMGPRLNLSTIPPHISCSNSASKISQKTVVEPPRLSAIIPQTANSLTTASSVTYVIPQGGQHHFPSQNHQHSIPSVPASQFPSSVALPPSSSQRISPVPHSQHSSTAVKPNASPRPSILRKRDFDGSTAKAQRNLTPLLNAVPTISSSNASPPQSPNLPDAAGGPSSHSSSTLSATSSPGLINADPDSPTQKSQTCSQNEEDHLRASSLIEMSPRKKPRKQQLIATTSIEHKLDDDMEFICDDKVKKEPKADSNQEIPKSSLSTSSASSKKPNISILTGYNHGWKSRHHHFLRYGDVKYKEEKRPSVSDIANQKYVSQKINGWKIYHISSQMEDLHEVEVEVVDRLSSLLKLLSNSSENDSSTVNRTHELIMGNMQRSKVISDQLQEAKTQMLKVFNHKKNVSDIINKYASKRTIRKKGRY